MRGALGVVLCAIVASSGCNARPELPPFGEAVVVVDTDLPVPRVVSRLRVDVFANGRWRDAFSSAIPEGGGVVRVPFEQPHTATAQGEGSAANVTWRVQVRPGAHDSEDATSVLVTPLALTADQIESAHAHSLRHEIVRAKDRRCRVLDRL